MIPACMESRCYRNGPSERLTSPDSKLCGMSSLLHRDPPLTSVVPQWSATLSPLAAPSPLGFLYHHLLTGVSRRTPQFSLHPRRRNTARLQGHRWASPLISFSTSYPSSTRLLPRKPFTDVLEGSSVSAMLITLCYVPWPPITDSVAIRGEAGVYLGPGVMTNEYINRGSRIARTSHCSPMDWPAPRAANECQPRWSSVRA
ncbi:hypothetical protein BV20DRAFT_785893 [Pilatotrama ljubarskyi]|nr:hypothetical protein BV20DRAFT_785893 [Pilatotrama ljubarskyi]